MGKRGGDLQRARIPAFGDDFQLVSAIILARPTINPGNSQRLSEILVHQAMLLEHIVTDQRYYSEYFRVAFSGNFPAAIRGKQFIVGRAFLLAPRWC